MPTGMCKGVFYVGKMNYPMVRQKKPHIQNIRGKIYVPTRIGKEGFLAENLLILCDGRKSRMQNIRGKIYIPTERAEERYKQAAVIFIYYGSLLYFMYLCIYKFMYFVYNSLLVILLRALRHLRVQPVCREMLKAWALYLCLLSFCQHNSL